MNKEKVKEFAKKHWRGIAKHAVLTCGCTVCYVAGYKACEDKWKLGLSVMCAADPDFKAKLTDTAKTVEARLS